MNKIFIRDFMRGVIGLVGISFICFGLLLFVNSEFIFWQVAFSVLGTLIIIGLRGTIKFRKKTNEGMFKVFFGDNFQPQNELEINRWDIGLYVGIDKNTGNILMISKSEKIVKGMGCKSLTGYECRGNSITLKFDDISFPCFTAYLSTEKESMAYCHKLDVILSPMYRPIKESGDDFSIFVQQKIKAA